MSVGILGRKVGMTQIFTEEGKRVPVTVIESQGCEVLQQKALKTDGYLAVQIGFGEKRESRCAKPLLGHFKKANVAPKAYIRELKFTKEDELQKYPVGTKIGVDLFKKGDYVDVTGTSIGKGFQGGFRRWHWRGGPSTHGSMSHRRPGSIGSSSDPSRVFKGHHLPGRMGCERVTVKNLEVINVDAPNNFLILKGGVPGPDKNLLFIRPAKTKKIRVKVEAPKPTTPATGPAKGGKAKEKEAKPTTPAKAKAPAAKGAPASSPSGTLSKGAAKAK